MQEVYDDRHRVLTGFIVVCLLLLLIQCFRLQVLDDTFREQQSYQEAVTIYPSRGAIKDRNGKLLVVNEPMYNINATYNTIKKSTLDTQYFCQLLQISDSTFQSNINKDWTKKEFSQRKPFTFLSQIPSDQFAPIQEQFYLFSGFNYDRINVRGYPSSVGAHMLGYISEVNNEQVSASAGLYRSGDYIGTSGLEFFYEDALRGEKGVEHVLKDKFGKRQGSYKNGELDVKATSGCDLITSIDLDLQLYGEQLMKNKRGAIVAIEPSSGEILAMISAPNYDPAILSINKNRKTSFEQLTTDTLKPLFNRALMAKYPPGSIFKTLLSAVALQEGIVTPNRGMACNGGFFYSGLRVGCHGHGKINNVGNAIQYSCNNYYCQVFRELVNVYGFYFPEKGMDRLAQHLRSWGLGDKLGIDLPSEASGHVPDAAFYNRRHGNNRWKFSTAVSVGIGQGELEITPLQMANIAVIIANRGYFYTPHIGKELVGDTLNLLKRFGEKRYTMVHPSHFEPVIQGMENVLTAGTGQRSRIEDIVICGKTGTVENSKGADHSTFIAFAPRENPKIAIAVYVENGGYGSTYAAPISSLMIEKYLRRYIKGPNRKYLETFILDANLINPGI